MQQIWSHFVPSMDMVLNYVQGIDGRDPLPDRCMAATVFPQVRTAVATLRTFDAVAAPTAMQYRRSCNSV